MKRFEENINNENTTVGSIVYGFIAKYRDKALQLFYEKGHVLEEIKKYASSNKIIEYISAYMMLPFVLSTLSLE